MRPQRSALTDSDRLFSNGRDYKSNLTVKPSLSIARLTCSKATARGRGPVFDCNKIAVFARLNASDTAETMDSTGYREIRDCAKRWYSRHGIAAEPGPSLKLVSVSSTY